MCIQVFDQVEFTARSGGRKLQQTGTTIYTGDAIRRAVNSGAAPRAVARAADIGVTTAFAKAQGDDAVCCINQIICFLKAVIYSQLFRAG